MSDLRCCTVSRICWNHSTSFGGHSLLVPLGPPLISPSDVAVSWDCYIYHNCPLLLYVWLVSQLLLVSLELAVPQDLGLFVLNAFRCVFYLDSGTSNPQSAQFFLHTIPATLLCRSANAVLGCNLTPCYYVLDCLSVYLESFLQWQNPAKGPFLRCKYPVLCAILWVSL